LNLLRRYFFSFLCSSLHVLLSLSLSEERVRERSHATRNHYRLSAGISLAGVRALHLSRRDRNRADLSSDKER